MTELQLQLEDVIRTAEAMLATVRRGQTPDLSDARILRGQAGAAEQLVEHAHVRLLRERTPEQDAAAQREMAGYGRTVARSRRAG